MCPWLRELRSQIPPGCDPSCAPACAHGAGANCSTIRTFDDVEAAAAPGKEAHRRWATRFLQNAPLDVTLHVPLVPWAPDSSRMCPFMCPCMCPSARWLQSQIPPGCAPSCAPSCAPGSVGPGARFLRDASLHVPLYVPLALLAPGQIPPGCAPSCAPGCAPGTGANCSKIRTFAAGADVDADADGDADAADGPGKEAHRRWAMKFDETKWDRTPPMSRTFLGGPGTINKVTIYYVNCRTSESSSGPKSV